MPDIDAVTVDHWDAVLRTNVIGTFLVSQAALPALQEAEDGWITNIASLAGNRQVGSSLPYGVKAAVDHLSAIMAKRRRGVRVAPVAPGLVATPWTADWGPSRGRRRPRRRCGGWPRPTTSPRPASPSRP